MKKSKIFFVSASVYPFVKNGRSAEFASSLPAHLQALGHEVRVLMPKYSLINERKHIIRDIIRMKDIPVKIHSGEVPMSVKSGFIPESKTQIYFVEYDKYFKRADLARDRRTGEYFKDNDERFIFLAKAAIATLKILGWQPDIVHCCDWQAGILPGLIREEQKTNPFFKKTIITYSVVDTDEAGLFDKSVFDKAFPSGIAKNDCLVKNKFSFLRAGLVHSDAFTLPATLKQHKTSPEVDAALAGLKPVPDLGFGCDPNFWNPANNNSLYKSYAVEKYDRKQVNREGFLEDKRTGFNPEEPILGILAERVESQGKEIASFLKTLKDVSLQIFLLSDDAASSSSALKSVVGKNGKHRFFTMADPDDYFRHNFYAVSDLLYIPPTEFFSEVHYLSGLRYGALPLLRNDAPVAGLFDGIKEKHAGTAFLYSDEKDLVRKTELALQIFKDKSAWEASVKKAMKADTSWGNHSDPVVRMYEKALAKIK